MPATVEKLRSGIIAVHPKEKKTKKKKPRQHSAGVITFKFAGAAKQKDH